MTDRREIILQRLVTIIEGVQGIQAVERNFIRPDEDLLPAVVVFDGDEAIADIPNPERWKDPSAPQMMTMRPEIYVRTAFHHSRVGTEMNILRARIHKALTADGQLTAHVGAGRGGNGRIMLERVQTGLGVGRTMEGEMILHYAFTYILSPSEL